MTVMDNGYSTPFPSSHLRTVPLDLPLVESSKRWKERINVNVSKTYHFHRDHRQLRRQKRPWNLYPLPPGHTLLLSPLWVSRNPHRMTSHFCGKRDLCRHPQLRPLWCTRTWTGWDGVIMDSVNGLNRFNGQINGWIWMWCKYNIGNIPSFVEPLWERIPNNGEFS